MSELGGQPETTGSNNLDHQMTLKLGGAALHSAINQPFPAEARVNATGILHKLTDGEVVIEPELQDAIGGVISSAEHCASLLKTIAPGTHLLGWLPYAGGATSLDNSRFQTYRGTAVEVPVRRSSDTWRLGDEKGAFLRQELEYRTPKIETPTSISGLAHEHQVIVRLFDGRRRSVFIQEHMSSDSGTATDSQHGSVVTLAIGYGILGKTRITMVPSLLFHAETTGHRTPKQRVILLGIDTANKKTYGDQLSKSLASSVLAGLAIRMEFLLRDLEAGTTGKATR